MASFKQEMIDYISIRLQDSYANVILTSFFRIVESPLQNR